MSEEVNLISGIALQRLPMFLWALKEEEIKAYQEVSEQVGSNKKSGTFI